MNSYVPNAGTHRTTHGVNLRSHLEVPEIDRAVHPVDPWRWAETLPAASGLGVSETLFAVGNGYLGLRGNPEEGRDSQQHGTYVNGFHETWQIEHAEDAFGLAREGQTIVNAPDAKTIRVYVDDEPLRLSVADLEDFSRSIDFREGILRREVTWRTPSGKRVEIRTSRMVSMEEKHLALFTYEIVLPDDAAPVVISSQLLNRQDGEDEYHLAPANSTRFDPRKGEDFSHRVLEPKLRRSEGEHQILGYKCANSGMTIAVAAQHQMLTENDYDLRTYIDDDSAKAVYHIHARPGRVIRLVKMAAYHTSRKTPVRELGHRCSRTLTRATELGVDYLEKAQRDWFTDFWERADVDIQGDAEMQQAIRWNLFQLAQVSARAETNGIAAKGVTGSGYSGHYFWDTETYVLPFLTYTLPRYARNALRFRYSMLQDARERATELSVDGALYPWRTINGKEASAYYEAGTAQYHINADIAHALVKYTRATGDYEFMGREGVDILVETARMWVSLGFFDSQGGFNIHGVTGPDEYTTVVDNNLFTNVMARANLRAAANVVAEIARRSPTDYDAMINRLKLKREEIDTWVRAAEQMVVCFDEELGVHPQDEHFLSNEVWDKDIENPQRPLLLHYHPLVIYRHQVLKQADVVLALFLRGADFTDEQKRTDFEYYDPLTTGDSTLSAVVQAIIAAEIGYAEEAYEHFSKALVVDLADVHGNAADGVHVASTGGVWSALVCGFGGMRDHRGNLTFDPRLPHQWNKLVYKLTVLDTRIRVEVSARDIAFVVEDGEETIDVKVQGRDVQIVPGERIEVPLQEPPHLDS